MSENKFKGTGVALVTPFQKDLSVDHLALRKLVNHVIDQGVNYLVALGTTAETPTLSKSEKIEILNTIIETCNARLPIVVGIGGNNTSEIIASFNEFPLDDVDAILSVSPYYNKPTQTGIIAHYTELNKFTTKPIIMYNVPSRTGSNMTASTTLHLAKECEHIIAIKEASGIMSQSMELVYNKPKGFTVLSGDDHLAMSQIACGFDGVISVAANCFTKDFSKMVQAALLSDFIQARQIFYSMLEGIDLLFTEGNPAGVKCVLSEMGICENIFRLPIVPVSPETHSKIKHFLKK